MIVLHVIGSLKKGGGAEEVLSELVKANTENTHIIVSLLEIKADDIDLISLGHKVYSLGVKGFPSLCFSVFRLKTIIRDCSPDVVQTWMYYSDLIGGLAAKMLNKPVVWGLHNSTLDSKGSSKAVRLTAKICAALSRSIPTQIISCSQLGKEVHAVMGYEESKITVVNNGYDTEKFTPLSGTQYGDVNKLHPLREIYSIPQEICLLGMVARYDSQKDHANLLNALRHLNVTKDEKWICILFGYGIDSGNSDLLALIQEYGLKENIILFGLSREIERHIRQLDIVLLSSKAEAFPNVLSEAMSSGVPCVSTDVGDAKLIVSTFGWIVPPRNPILLAEAISRAMDEFARNSSEWNMRKINCRLHIQENYSLEKMADGYKSVWAKCSG